MAKRSTAAFKVFTMLLFGDYSFNHWNEDRITIASGPFCRFFNINPNRLDGYFQELTDAGLISEVDRPWGKITFTVALPEHIRRMGFTIDILRAGVKK